MISIFNIPVNTIPEHQFIILAEKLFNNYILKTPISNFRFAEIEFYFFNKCPHPNSHDYYPDNNSLYGPPLEYADWKKTTSWVISHQDYFTHHRGNQTKSAHWYLHMDENGKLKNGNRKGIDLTIGDEEQMAFGGILIRAIQNVGTKEYIYGPSKVVDKLITDLCKTDINDISEILEFSAEDFKNKIHIAECNLVPLEFFSCKRHGLKINAKKIPEQKIGLQKAFLDKDYRYFILPLEKHLGKESFLKDWVKSRKFGDETEEKILKEFHRKIKI